MSDAGSTNQSLSPDEKKTGKTVSVTTRRQIADRIRIFWQ